MTDQTSPSLPELIDMQIRTTGPMSVATYMGLCLTHPTKGYYKGADPLGAAGDFVTAPEISQMFGELIGFFIVNLWQQMGSPREFTLLELGPGRGTLMADVLRVACRAEGFRDGLDLRLFETNPALIAEQNARLEAYGAKWIDGFDKVGPGPLLVVANEFFDALPIRQFVRAEDGWHERMVGTNNGRRVFGLNPTPIPASAMPEALADAEINAVLEVGLASGEVMNRLASTISTQGGRSWPSIMAMPAPRPGKPCRASAVISLPTCSTRPARSIFPPMSTSRPWARLPAAPALLCSPSRPRRSS